MISLKTEVIGFFDQMLYPEEKPLPEALSEINGLVQNRQVKEAEIVLYPFHPEDPTEVRIFLGLHPVNSQLGQEHTIGTISDDLFIAAKIENAVLSLFGVEVDTMLAVEFKNESDSTEVILTQVKNFCDQEKLSIFRTLKGKTIKEIEFREHNSESELHIGFEDGSLLLLRSRTQPAAVLRFEGSERGIFRKATLSKSKVVA